MERHFHRDHVIIFDTMPSTQVRRLLLLLGLFAVTAIFATAFIGWPLNRDITTYATIAQELLHGKRLYVDVWDIKPPAIFATYMAAQWLVALKPLQILVLDLVPTLVVLTALVYSAEAAGFRSAAGVWSGLFWVALSSDILFQTQEPNTEIFINACCSVAFLQILRFESRFTAESRSCRSRWLRSLAIGLLFGVACLYKTVAIAIAIGLGAAHLLLAPAGTFPARLRQLSLMAAVGAASLAATAAYFAVTERWGVFREAMVDAGRAHAGGVWHNLIDGFTLAPLLGENVLLGAVVAIAPWALVIGIARLDRTRTRAWLLLGIYALSALAAVALPGHFYAHYFQLLLPALCLGLGWLIGAADALPWHRARRAAPFCAGLALAALCVYELRVFRAPAEDVVAGSYQELYFETEALARRLGTALEPDEVLFQWGEESGLYWFSGKRPPAAVLANSLVSGPQAERLTDDTLQALRSRPPDLIVVANYAIDAGTGHPVFEWIRSNYLRVLPHSTTERKYFTFYLPSGAPRELGERVMGAGASTPSRGRRPTRAQAATSAPACRPAARGSPNTPPSSAVLPYLFLKRKGWL